MTALKPVCGRCGEEHWRFVPCAEVDAANELEARKQALKVVPEYRTGKDREPRDRLLTLVQQAPNVFVHKR